MADITPIKRDKRGYIVLNQCTVTLGEIIDIANREFLGAPDDAVYFPQPNYLDDSDDFLIDQIKPHDWQKLDDGFQTSMPPRITLSQVLLQAEFLPGSPDIRRVGLMWDKQGFHLYIHT